MGTDAECYEVACKSFSEELKKLACQISIAVPTLKDVEWQYDKKKTKVCDADENGRKKRMAVGEAYYSHEVNLTHKDALVIWKIFRQFAKDHGFNRLDRMKNNEKTLGWYKFEAEDTSHFDWFLCSINVPGEWSPPLISVRLVVGPRYRKADLQDTSMHS